MTGVHRDTNMRLGVRVGKGCQTLLDHRIRELFCFSRASGHRSGVQTNE
jgi:hypothetical protein